MTLKLRQRVEDPPPSEDGIEAFGTMGEVTIRLAQRAAQIHQQLGKALA